MARAKAAKAAEKEPEIDDNLRHLELSDTEKAGLQAGIAAKAREARPLKLDHYTKRNDDDVLQGHFCRIEKGDHRNEIGTFISVVSEDDDGYPDVIQVELRNSALLVVVDYADVTPVEFGGR